jgi:hypothetical protein
VGGVRTGRALPTEPADDRVEVVGRRGERVLGRPAVVDAEHGAAAAVGDPPADAVVDVDVVEHEAAAVRMHDQTGHRVGGGVEPAAHTVGVDLLDRGHLLARLTEAGAPRLLPVGCEVEAGGRQAGAVVGLDRCTDLGIHHVGLLDVRVSATSARRGRRPRRPRPGSRPARRGR